MIPSCSKCGSSFVPCDCIKIKLPSRKTNRSEVLTMRISPETLNAAKLVAQVTCRTVSGLAEYALQRFIEHNFPEAYEQGAKITIKVDDCPST